MNHINISKSIKPFGIIAFIMTMGMIISSCEHQPDVFYSNNNNNNNNNDSSSNSDIPCDPDSVYFQNDILPLFVTNCARSGCHDQASHKEGLILDSYTNIINTGNIQAFNPNHGDILDVITTSDPDDKMPPSPYSALKQTEIDMLIKWINQGALNNSCDNCDSVAVTFAGIIQPLIQKKCEGCHGNTNPGGGINLTAYSGIQAIALNGKLEGSVTHATGYSPMPKGTAKLPDCEIQRIQTWIAGGATNN